MSYSREIEFFRRVMLGGGFREAVSFVQTFENRLSREDMRRIIVEIYRQKLFELIEEPDEEELRELFERELVSWCREEEF